MIVIVPIRKHSTCIRLKSDGRRLVAQSAACNERNYLWNKVTYETRSADSTSMSLWFFKKKLMLIQTLVQSGTCRWYVLHVRRWRRWVMTRRCVLVSYTLNYTSTCCQIYAATRWRRRPSVTVRRNSSTHFSGRCSVSSETLLLVAPHSVRVSILFISSANSPRIRLVFIAYLFCTRTLTALHPTNKDLRDRVIKIITSVRRSIHCVLVCWCWWLKVIKVSPFLSKLPYNCLCL